MVLAYPDIAKAANDLLNKDFYHTVQTEVTVKTAAPNGVQFSVSGKSDHKNAITGKLEAKYSDKPSGLTLTQGWEQNNTLLSKFELDSALAKGLKAEIETKFNPATTTKAAVAGLLYTQPNFVARGYLDLLKGPSFKGNVAVGHEGFVAGGEVGYDVVDARITEYSAAAGYSIPEYTASLVASNNLSVFAASYYHRVNSQVEAGGKASWDSKSASNNIALELAAKYAIEKDAFTKIKLNNSGIACVSYQQALRPGVKLGLGLSVDTQRLNEAAHKVGLSFSVDA